MKMGDPAVKLGVSKDGSVKGEAVKRPTSNTSRQ